MDVGATNGWRMDEVVTAGEMVDTINADLPIEPTDANYRGEVAKRWRFKDGGGELGIISSVSEPFCRDCSRARLSAKGTLYTCLFATCGHDLRQRLRDGRTSDGELRDHLIEIWSRRGDRYSEIRSEHTITLPKIEMSYIGG